MTSVCSGLILEKDRTVCIMHGTCHSLSALNPSAFKGEVVGWLMDLRAACCANKRAGHKWGQM